MNGVVGVGLRECGHFGAGVDGVHAVAAGEEVPGVAAGAAAEIEDEGAGRDVGEEFGVEGCQVERDRGLKVYKGVAGIVSEGVRHEG